MPANVRVSRPTSSSVSLSGRSTSRSPSEIRWAASDNASIGFTIDVAMRKAPSPSSSTIARLIPRMRRMAETTGVNASAYASSTTSVQPKRGKRSEQPTTRSPVGDR